MATQTPLTHPNFAKQTQNFYPHSATFKTTGATGQQITAFESPCAYEGAIGGDSADFESEAPANDKLLLPAWHPEIVAGQLVVLQLPGKTKRFTVLDSVPSGSTQTLVSITPKN